jgi:hypothetical protein
MSATLDREVLEALEWFDRDDPAWRDFLDLSVRWPPYQSQAELDAIRKESRWLASSHPFAIAALEVRASYVVGSGHQYKVRAKPVAQVDQSTLDKVRQEIDEFVERNKWFLLQRENQFRLDRDGEVFLRFFEEDGYLVVRYIEPEDVQTPLSLAASPECSIRHRGGRNGCRNASGVSRPLPLGHAGTLGACRRERGPASGKPTATGPGRGEYRYSTASATTCVAFGSCSGT